MIVGATLNSMNVVEFRLPYIFQIGASVLVGWFVGLGFNRHCCCSATQTALAFPLGVSADRVVCHFCLDAGTGFAHCISLTAYLATTPGGLDSVILLAMGSGGSTDVPFVVATQTCACFWSFSPGRWSLAGFAGTPEAITSVVFVAAVLNPQRVVESLSRSRDSPVQTICSSANTSSNFPAWPLCGVCGTCFRVPCPGCPGVPHRSCAMRF